MHIKSLKQALNHGLKFKKIHRIIEFNQKSWLKPYTDMNTELRKLAKGDFEKDLFKLINNAVFGTTLESIRKHRDLKLVTTDKKKKEIGFRTKLSYNELYFRRFINNRNE